MGPVELVTAQLEGYNARDIDAFCKPFASNVSVYSLNDEKLLLQGIDKFRKSYGALFESSPKLHAKVTNRLVLNNFVVDEETVTGRYGEDVQAIAIYKITGNKISHVWFAR